MCPDIHCWSEIDELLDDKADKDTVYTKTETDTLLDSKANEGDSYLKAETYNTTEVDNKLDDKADTATTYTKTEVDDSQDLQDVEIAKKADKATTYTKEEVDDLLEATSGAIVGNYTNKWASAVARDPGAGNLYLAYGVNISTKYEEVTKIFISDTDGDGKIRDFDEVKEDDKVTLTSENGSGEYTISTISDMGGYRELVVSTESSAGTIANDTAVSIVLDVASSGEATGGGTVANGCIYLNKQTIEDDYTIPVGMNGMSAGAIEFNGTVTVPEGSKYHVVDSQSGGDSIWTIKNDGFHDYAFYDGPIEFTPNTTTNYDKDDILISDVGHLYRADRHTYVKDLTINGVTVGIGKNEVDSNTVVGRKSLVTNTDGTENTAVGKYSLQYNQSGKENTAVGMFSLNKNIDGNQNSSFGRNSLFSNENGIMNTAIGEGSLYSNTGDKNTAIGRGAGYSLTSGTNNTLIGNGAQPSAPDVSNEVTIGNDAVTRVRFPFASSNWVGNANELTFNCQDFKIKTGTDGKVIDFVIGTSQTMKVQKQKVTITNDLTLPNLPTSGTPANLYITEAGTVHKSTATTYTAEETETAIDKKLAIKDKIIEALEARLTKLEARNK